MNAREFLGYVTELELKVNILSEENIRLKSSAINARDFDKAALTTEAVAALHNVHQDTIRKYVSIGCIERHPDSTDAKILIRASEALMLDFKELRKKGKHI